MFNLLGAFVQILATRSDLQLGCLFLQLTRQDTIEEFMHAENYVRRRFLQRGLGQVHVSGRDLICLVDLDELRDGLGNHGSAGFESLRALGKKNVRRGDVRTEGPGRHLDSLQIGDVQKSRFVRDRGKVAGPGDAAFLLFRRDLVGCGFQAMVCAQREIDGLLDRQFAFLAHSRRRQRIRGDHHRAPAGNRVLPRFHRTFLQQCATHNGSVFIQTRLRANRQKSESQSRVIMNSIPCARAMVAETRGGHHSSVATCAAMQSGEDPQRRTKPPERSHH